jgi:NAD(P)-dependent dehydrogenase (short-subunit alcohol dehydrogenase family)
MARFGVLHSLKMPSVLVTGASRGLGRELASVYRERGWTVFPLVRTAEAAAEWSAAGGDACHPIVADLSSAALEAAIAAKLAVHTRALDLLINNAGQVRKLRWLPETRPEDIEDLLRVHCVGAFRCTRVALPFLRAAPQPTVVNVTSRFGSLGMTVAGGFRGIYSYSIAKCAQNMLTACLDQELRKDGIRVFAVHPGRLRTSVAAVDADTDPREAAARLADWVASIDRDAECALYDVMSGAVIPW